MTADNRKSDIERGAQALPSNQKSLIIRSVLIALLAAAVLVIGHYGLRGAAEPVAAGAGGAQMEFGAAGGRDAADLSAGALAKADVPPPPQSERAFAKTAQGGSERLIAAYTSRGSAPGRHRLLPEDVAAARLGLRRCFRLPPASRDFGGQLRGRRGVGEGGRRLRRHAAAVLECGEGFVYDYHLGDPVRRELRDDLPLARGRSDRRKKVTTFSPQRAQRTEGLADGQKSVHR